MTEKTRKLIIYIMICIATIFMLVVILKLNQNRIDENLKKTNISDYLRGINYDEISNFVQEEPKVVIYVTKGNIDKAFERNLISVIKKYNLENEMIYINITDANISDPIYQNAPELILYSDGKITDMINGNVLKSKNDIIKILRERGIIND